MTIWHVAGACSAVLALVVVANPAEQLHDTAGRRLRWTRQLELERDRQFDLALAAARELLDEPQTTSAESELLLDRIAFDLFNLDRLSEAVAWYDQRIQDAVDHPRERMRLLAAKAELLLSHAEPALVIAGCREYQLSSVPKSADWQRATAMLALALSRNGLHDEALALRQELLAQYPAADDPNAVNLLIDIARSQQALRMSRQALVTLGQAAQTLDRITAGSPDIEGLREEIGVLQRSLRNAR